MALRPEETRDSLKFGEDFELDLRAFELRRAGRVLRLEPTPMELLSFLIERRGELVSRDQIIDKIWGQGVFLDTDNSINGAIRKIRQVLGDNPEQPRFVQTITGKGYRFIAQVIEPAAEELQERDAEAARAAKTVGASVGTLLGKSWKVFVAAATAVGGLTLAAYFYFPRTPELTDKDTIVLADFTNKTGDPVFDETLRQGLAVQLEQSPFLGLVSDAEIQETLRMMGQPPEARLSPQVAREACQRTNSAAVLEGTISQIGSHYLLTLEAVNCASGKSLGSTEVQASDKNRVLDALGKAASQIRERLGESLSTVQKFDVTLEQATTSSLDALKAFSLGTRIWSTAGSAAAIPFYKRAIELDPSFALAHAWLGRLYGDIGETSLAAEYTRRAYELRDRTSEPEKYFISASFQIVVAGNMEQARETCELWKQVYSRAEMPHDFLAGLIYPVVGQNDKGVEEASEGVRAFPDRSMPPSTLMFSYIATNHLNEAKATYDEALKHKLDIPLMHIALYELAFLQNDPAGMAREVSWSAGKPGVEDELLDLESHTAAYAGRVRKARDLSDRARDSAESAAEHETAAMYLAVSGLREALYGNPAEARRRASLAIRRSTGRDLQYGVALALAYAGDNQRAEALARDLEKRFREDTLVQRNYLPTLNAKLAINRGNSSAAIESLKAAASYELGESTALPYSWYALYPAFVRGEALLAARKGKEAAVEFQKVLDQSGLVLNEPIGALAHLQSGRAFALSGDTTSARSAYEDFLALWKDADPDVAILKQAKPEYSRLQ